MRSPEPVSRLYHGAVRRNRYLCRTRRTNNRLAHFLRNRGLKRLDHYSIFMENNARYIECCGAASDRAFISPASIRS